MIPCFVERNVRRRRDKVSNEVKECHEQLNKWLNVPHAPAFGSSLIYTKVESMYTYMLSWVRCISRILKDKTDKNNKPRKIEVPFKRNEMNWPP